MYGNMQIMHLFLVKTRFYMLNSIIYQNNSLPHNSGKSHISTLSLQPHSSPPNQQLVVF